MAAISWPRCGMGASILFNTLKQNIVILMKFSSLASGYRQISNIRCTKSQKLNVSRLVLQLSWPNLLKPCIKLRMKMWLE